MIKNTSSLNNIFSLSLHLNETQYLKASQRQHFKSSYIFMRSLEITNSRNNKSKRRKPEKPISVTAT